MSSERTSEPAAVTCHGLGKAYRVYERPHHRMLELLGLRDPEKSRKRWALRGVDLEIRRGECVGIVGRNGAGKSTLLQIIAGTVRATEGAAAVNGRVAALLELNAGFNPELTGRENVGLRAMVLGLTPRQARERMDDIIAFSGIGAQVDEAVRTYSSGMRARLAFAVAAHVDADVLIVDETLAVGDGVFVQKCMRWIRAFRAQGTLLFVSHSTQLVTDLCDRAVWLEGGEVRMDGVAKEVVRAYSEETHRQATGDASIHSGKGLRGSDDAGAEPLSDDVRSERLAHAGLRPSLEEMRLDSDAAWWGRGGARVESIRLLDEHGRPMKSLESGRVITIEIRCSTSERLGHPVLGFIVRNARGLVLFSDNSWLAFGPDGPGPIEAGRSFVAHIRVRFPFLPAGEYALGGAIADGVPKHFIQHHRVDDALLFRVPTSHLVEGIVGIPMLGCEIRDLGVGAAASPVGETER